MKTILMYDKSNNLISEITGSIVKQSSQDGVTSFVVKTDHSTIPFACKNGRFEIV